MSLSILSTRTGDYVKAVLASHWPNRSGALRYHGGMVSACADRCASTFAYYMDRRNKSGDNSEVATTGSERMRFEVSRSIPAWVSFVNSSGKALKDGINETIFG